MKVLGIDPSLTGTGVVTLSGRGKVLSADHIRSYPVKTYPLEVKRIRGITDTVLSAAEGCSLAVMEGLAFMAHNTTALVQLSALNYFIREGLMNMEIPFIIVAPSSLKKFVTGKGNAKKDSIFLEVYKRWGESFTNDNEADAYGMAQIAWVLANPGVEKGLPEFQQEVITLLKTQLL